MVNAPKHKTNPMAPTAINARPIPADFFLFSISQAQKLKAASRESVLTKDKIHGIMSARSPSVKPREPQLTVAVSKVERYFPKGFSSEQMESIILKLLENYYRKRQDYER